MKKLIFLLALLWALPAWAQNPTCPTRPAGDNSNACASTAFVNQYAPFPLTVPHGGTGQSSFTANNPLLGNGTSAIAQGTRSGTTTVFGTVGGSPVNGNCTSWNNGNLIDAGSPCGSGGGGSGTVTAGLANQIAYYPTNGTTVSGSLCSISSAGLLNCPEMVLGNAATLSGNTIYSSNVGATTPGGWNIGWGLATWRWGVNLTSTSSQNGSMFACDTHGINSPGAGGEYDCAWFLNVAYSTGNGVSSDGSGVVGLRDEAYIPASNSSGAVWAGIDYADILSGGEGDEFGREIDINNNGVGAGSILNGSGHLNRPIKIGIWLAGYGNAASAAIGISPGSKFNVDYWGSQNGITSSGSFLWLDNNNGSPLFYVGRGGVVGSVGTQSRQGTNGAVGGGHPYNIFWTGTNAQLWVDSTNIGNISTTSDPRVKHDIVPLPGDALSEIMALRPVEFSWSDIGIFKDDGERQVGFLANEVQKVIPDAANGKPDGMNSDGSIAAMSVNTIPLVATLTKAVQELKAQLDAERQCRQHWMCRIFGIGA